MCMKYRASNTYRRTVSSRPGFVCNDRGTNSCEIPEEKSSFVGSHRCQSHIRQYLETEHKNLVSYALDCLRF